MWISLAAARNWRLAPRGVRYLFVGFMCGALNNVLLIAAVRAGVHYLAALSLVCPVMLIIGYMLHVSVTFDVTPSAASFLRYSLAVLANYPIWIASLFVMCDLAHAPILLAGPAATLFVFAMNYVTAHWAIEGSLRAAFKLRAGS